MRGEDLKYMLGPGLIALLSFLLKDKGGEATSEVSFDMSPEGLDDAEGRMAGEEDPWAAAIADTKAATVPQGPAPPLPPDVDMPMAGAEGEPPVQGEFKGGTGNSRGQYGSGNDLPDSGASPSAMDAAAAVASGQAEPDEEILQMLLKKMGNPYGTRGVF